jgi:hypothetical protein
MDKWIKNFCELRSNEEAPASNFRALQSFLIMGRRLPLSGDLLICSFNCTFKICASLRLALFIIGTTALARRPPMSKTVHGHDGHKIEPFHPTTSMYHSSLNYVEPYVCPRCSLCLLGKDFLLRLVHALRNSHVLLLVAEGLFYGGYSFL